MLKIDSIDQIEVGFSAWFRIIHFKNVVVDKNSDFANVSLSKCSKILENNAEHVSAEVKRQLLNDPQFAFLGNSKEAEGSGELV